jgi:hypothetical protein
VLGNLHDAARWRIDHEAGPDRSAEFAALAPRPRRASPNHASTRANANRFALVCPVGSVAKRGILRTPNSTTYDRRSTKHGGASNELFENAKRRAHLADAERGARRALTSGG